MTAARLARGRWGEDRAEAWYRQHGYQIVDRNWRCARGEIDLVARQGDLLVIVEVKARSSDRYGTAAAAVHPGKQRRLRGLAIEWLRAHGQRRVDLRFDVVAITGGDLRVYHAAF
ncbi:MAG: YraN family protein [Desertimonas sp.]